MRFFCLLLLLLPSFQYLPAQARGTVPTFRYTAGTRSYTFAGTLNQRNPSKATTSTIPTVLVPVTLSFEAKQTDGKPFVLDAAPDVPLLLHSPVFSDFAFGPDRTQYADAMLRATFPQWKAWHTLLGQPQVRPVRITVPVRYGYVLTSKKEGRSFGVVDAEFLQRAIFKQVPRQDGSLVIAFAHNTAYYAVGDATVCCSWGAHGFDQATGNSFVLSSYLHDVPTVVQDGDVQPLTQQLAEFVNDPLHDPLLDPGKKDIAFPGNTFSPWMRPASMQPGDEGPCGGTGIASTYFLLEPTDTNPKNDFPLSRPFIAREGAAAYHLENVALLPWYTGPASGLSSVYSFPDPRALARPAEQCPPRRRLAAHAGMPTASPVPLSHSPNGHKLIGYWTGHGAAGSPFPLSQVSPQWDIVIVAFAAPAKNAPEGTLRFQVPPGLDPAAFKADIVRLKQQGKKVMISLGGGGAFFTLAHARSIPNFVSSVESVVSEYGFDGVDIDFESPSLDLVPGDTDFKHPTTPSVVNLISGLRQLRDHFGPGFMISLVPEGTQIPAGHVSYGGQFGSYLPLTYAIRDILSFIDVQDYNTPPLEGLDGEIYQSGPVDYHAAMTEHLLQGFHVGGKSGQFFPPLPADKIAAGMLVGYTTPTTVSQSMNYLITGHAPVGTRYRLRNPGGYPSMIGAMFWTIDDDRLENYSFSNLVGPQLHSYPPAR